MRPIGWVSACMLAVLLTACGSPQDNAPKKNPVDCLFNGPCTGK